jgi:hypothetical protein
MDKATPMQEEFLLPELLPHLVKFKGEILVRHFLCQSPFPVSPTKKTVFNSMANSTYRIHHEPYNKYLQDKDYERVFLFIEKAHKLQWFIDHYEMMYNHLGDKKYYRLLRDTLVEVNYHYYTKKHYHKLLAIGNDPLNMMNEYERKVYNKFPDRFEIYRGVCSNEPITPKNIEYFIGNSWTLDKKKSVWFAKNFYPYERNPYYVNFTYEASKPEVLSYFSNRKEKEIFVDYSILDYDRIIIEELN